MVRLHLETDPALVGAPCLRWRTRRAEYFLWWDRWPRFYRLAGVP